MMEKLDGVNKVHHFRNRNRRALNKTELPTGEIEVVPEGIEILDVSTMHFV